jgi:tetratricopeptide (TPR) repeat protein
MIKTEVSRIGLTTVLIVAVCAVVLFVHWPALSAKALCFDDDVYFTGNSLVRNPSWESAKLFLTEVLEPSTVKGYYQPLTMISLMLDYAIGGQTDSLVPFHRTSLLLHVANTALIIILLYQLFGNVWIAAAVGLLFGVHPLTVEPIPWVGERKTLLAAFFTLWSLILYVRFARKDSWKSYIGCFVMYVLALMSKPTSTPLPAMLLLMDYWPLRRLKWRAILEKLPLFVIGGISAVITYISQSRTASVETPQAYGLMRVPLVICHDIIFYLYKIVWPTNLSSYYAFPEPLVISTPMVMIAVIGTCILILILMLSLRWTRAALTGWLIFFVMIFPTMQMIQFSRVIASDKFAYLPSVGLLMVLAAFLSWTYGTGSVRQHPTKSVLIAVIVLILAGAESFAARRHLADWKDTVSLFTRMIKTAPNAIPPLNNLGAAYFEKGDTKQAIECFTQVLKIKPEAAAYNNLGVILSLNGRIDEAVECHKNAIQLDPKNAEAYYNLANILLSQNNFKQAIDGYEKAVTITPKYTKAHINLAVALMRENRFDEAIEHAAQAVKIEPRNVDAHYNLAVALRQQGRLGEAIEHFIKAAEINPNNADAHYDLAMTLAQQNRLDEAVEHFAKAAKIDPNNVKTHYNLAIGLWQQGRLGEAADEFRQVLRLQPQDANTHCFLGDVLARQGQSDQAVVEYQNVLKIDPNHPRAQQGLKDISNLKK